MIGYYLDLAVRSLRRNVALTVLMIVAIAFGVGASMTTLTVLRLLSADPIPGKSDQLFYVQVEPRPAEGTRPKEPTEQMTRRDAETLLHAAKADKQTMTTGGNVAIEPQRAGLDPFFADARWSSVDFFSMFRVPFVAGAAWTADDDAQAAHVVVIAKALAEKLFGKTDVIGQTILVEGTSMRIVGVMDRWVPTPHFYDLTTGDYGKEEQVFVPFSTAMELKLGHSGTTNCWGDREDNEALDAPCEWIQYWVELDSPAKAAAYRDYLVRYSEEQQAAGRFGWSPNVRLRNVMQWLDYKEVVPSDARLQTWIALGFLLVCLINTVGLLLTKFLRRSSEIGVRRALGASKRQIFAQLLIEAGIIGVVGGILGLGLAWLGLFAVRHQPASYAELAHLDLPMLAATFALAVVSAVLAGVLPAWRGCQVTPALQLKSH
ncbi:MAG: FtsX-like permease family protein [Kofleriaceae bacterium]|nr:FtsX-like permease family protein [Kofleriaceae bacterium]